MSNADPGPFKEFSALPAGEIPGPDDLPPDEPSGPPTATTAPFDDGVAEP